jgi:hypothetical protein
VENFWKHKNGNSGLCGRCKECMSKQHSSNRSAMRYRAKQVYGLTLEEYDELKARSSFCPLCFSAEELHLDHNDQTGKVREFICGKCNRGLGLFNHDPELLRAAAIYMEVHNQ